MSPPTTHDLSPVLAPEVAVAHVDDPTWLFVDCRFRLTDVDFGERAFREATVPGAVYAGLSPHLSGPHVPGHTGRHPLPEISDLEALLRGFGVDDATKVVAFDDSGGSMAARLWWLLRFVGHTHVHVLDGGWQAYVAAGGKVAPGTSPSGPSGTFVARPDATRLATVEEVLARSSAATSSSGSGETGPLFDARAPARFRGDEEPLDPVGGHIPGAHNVPFSANLGEDGRFLPATVLRARYLDALEGHAAEDAIVYCGSGVTACHDLLAMDQAGLGLGRLYVDSWSGWITDPRRAIERGSAGE